MKRKTSALTFTLVFALAMSFAVGSLHAAFHAGMTSTQIQSEVSAQLARGNSAQAIGENALAAGLGAATVTVAMLNAGISADTVVSALIRAGGNASTVISAAVTAGANTNLVTSGALAAGVPQQIITAAINSAPPPGGGGGGSTGGGGTGGSDPDVNVTTRLQVTDPSGSVMGTSKVFVTGPSGTLGGTGLVTGQTTVSIGGRLAPGLNTTGPNANFGAVGTLSVGTVGGLSLNAANTPAGAYLDFDLTSSAAAANDRINTSALTLGSGIVFTFNGLSGSLLDVTAPYTLIATSGSNTITGFDASNISTEFLGSLNGLYTATYFVDANNDLVVRFAVPEPGPWSLVVGGAGLLLGFQRARRRPSGRG